LQKNTTNNNKKQASGLIFISIIKLLQTTAQQRKSPLQPGKLSLPAAVSPGFYPYLSLAAIERKIYI